MQEKALIRYSDAIGDATEAAAQDELSATLMVACLTKFIDVVVRCADDDSYKPHWSSVHKLSAADSSTLNNSNAA